MNSKPYQLPAAPEGTELIVRSRIVEGGATELKAVEATASGSYSPFAPLAFFTAFDATGAHLGTWSPGYQSMGWNRGWPGFQFGMAAEELFRVRSLAGKDESSESFVGKDAIREAKSIWARVLAGKTAASLWTLR